MDNTIFFYPTDQKSLWKCHLVLDIALKGGYGKTREHSQEIKHKVK